MKKLLFTAIVAVAGWFNAQAQSMPAPEKYNDFIEQVATLEQTKAEFLIAATMESLASDPKGYRQMLELAEKRFSDAADPIHNEGLYLAVLKHATEKFVLSNAEKEKQRLLLEGAKKNMIGTVAADFDYITPDDKTVRHLKELSADYILVYFNNPDCESCEKVKERLAENELVNQLIKEKKLQVLAIYPYEDSKLWKKTKYPKMMINGWNQSQSIEYGELYDLPTLPCFYLLDKNYTVLVKNEGSLNKVEAKLKQLTTAQEVGPTSPAAATEKPADAKPASVPADPNDPNTISSEQLLNYVLNNQGEEIYNSLSEDTQKQTKPIVFDNILEQLESKAGKYQGHEPWQIRKMQGRKAYTSILSFEKRELGMFVVYDQEGKVLGINFIPAEVLKH